MSASERDWMNNSQPNGPGGNAPFYTRWSITKWLIVLNVALFALGMFWVVPSPFRGEVSIPGPMLYGYYSVHAVWEDGQFWRLITYQFIHASVGHLLFNMIALYYFGSMMERIIGRSRYLLFYLMCGIAGALFSSLLASFGLFEKGEMFAMWGHIPMVGASGSIYGILAAGAVVFPATRVQLIFPPIELSMRTFAIALLVLATAFILFGWTNAGGEAGHMGGMIMGFLLIQLPFFRRKTPGRILLTPAPDKEKVNRLLDKVSREGLHSLTDSEREYLLKISEEMKKRRN